MLKRDLTHPLPDALRARLLAIPEQTALCRDVDRLYAAARASAAGGRPEAAAAAHLAGCARCRRLYGAVEHALAEPDRPAPPRLLARLKQIPRQSRRRSPVRRPPVRRPLPVWIVDTRYAAAACYLLAAFLTLLAGDVLAGDVLTGDAPKLLRGATETVSERTTGLLANGSRQGRAAWQGVIAAAESGYARGRATVAGYGEEGRQLWHDTARDLESGLTFLRQQIDSVITSDNQGENHDHPTDDR